MFREYVCSVCGNDYVASRYSSNPLCSQSCRDSSRSLVTQKVKQKTYQRRFITEGGFHPTTKFRLIGSATDIEAPGNGSVWEYKCVDCGQVVRSTTSCLLQGKRPCKCSPHRQQEAYINLLYDDINNVVAIKFGIANNSNRRVKQQDTKSTYEVRQYQVYSFPSVASCKQAERECKKELECGVVLKRDMPDGYSETTWAYNVGKVKSIYERNGGVLV